MIGKAKDFLVNMVRPISNENAVMDLQDFLDFMDFMEDNIQHNPEYQAFNSLVRNLDKCIISGSSVLAYRLGHKNVSNDVDLFIEDTVENQAIVKDFFGHSEVQDSLKKFSSKKYKNVTGSIGRYNVTSLSQYGMIKLDCKLTTSRFDFNMISGNSVFDLNFIFIRRLNKDERLLLGENQETTLDLYSKNYSHLDNSLSDSSNQIFFDESLSYLKKIQEIYPKGIAAHFVHQSFDFEELKYAYCFSFKQAISLLNVGGILTTIFNHRLDQLKLNNEKDIIMDTVINRYQNLVAERLKSLDTREDVFLKLTSNSKTLHISKDMISRSTSIKLMSAARKSKDNQSLESIYGNVLSIGTKRVYQETLNIHINLIARISKYTERGFNIVDLKNITGLCQSYINGYNLYINSNKEIKHIAIKNGIVLGGAADINITQRLRTTYKKYNEIILKNDIKVYEIEDETSKGVSSIFEL